ADLQAIEALLALGAPSVRMVHDHDVYCMRSYKYHYFSREICTRPASPYCVFPCGAFLGRNHHGRAPVKWVSYSAKKKEIQLNRQFDRLIVGGGYMRDELLRNGFRPDKIEIHAPVPPNGGSIRSEFSERNVILYAGQITRGKGVDVLLEALAQVRAPFECFIFGDGNHRSFCERSSRKLGLTKRVHFKGFVPQDELQNYYREASVMVLSSVWPEPFGAVGLEGMRCGLPVVAFDAGGIKEWLLDGYNGFLVPWMDRAQFAARVEELLLNKTLARQMGERGLELVTKRYDFAKYITGLEELFRRLIADKEPHDEPSRLQVQEPQLQVA
ncbi:MAG TPA: glycosyltransferase, partial [Verrucomicrobiae bacterium]